MNIKFRKKGLLKFLIFISIIFLSSNSHQSLITVKAQSYTNVSVQEAYSMINNNTAFPDLIILDVRNQDEYDSERICDATLIPVSHLNLGSVSFCLILTPKFLYTVEVEVEVHQQVRFL